MCNYRYSRYVYKDQPHSTSKQASTIHAYKHPSLAASLLLLPSSLSLPHFAFVIIIHCIVLQLPTLAIDKGRGKKKLLRIDR